MGSSHQMQRTHHKPGQKSDTEYGYKGHPQACPQREILTVEPGV